MPFTHREDKKAHGVVDWYRNTSCRGYLSQSDTPLQFFRPFVFINIARPTFISNIFFGGVSGSLR